MKQEIKNWLIDFLGIKSIIKNFGHTRMRSIHNECDIKEMNRQIKALQKMLYIGVDVHHNTNSWAVICIDGKPNFVKFYDLGNEDARYIREFLNQFEYSKRLIDAPYTLFEIEKW